MVSPEFTEFRLRFPHSWKPAVDEGCSWMCMAMGGSTNAVLHIPAVAAEAGISVDLGMFDRIARETPHICAIIPSGAHGMAEIHQAGGVPAVLNRLAHLIKDAHTVNEHSILEIAASGKALDDDVIRPLEPPLSPPGGNCLIRCK